MQAVAAAVGTDEQDADTEPRAVRKLVHATGTAGAVTQREEHCTMAHLVAVGVEGVQLLWQPFLDEIQS